MRDLMGMMKQARELQGKMEQLQQEVAALEVEGSAGGGLVTAVMTGKSEMKRIHVDPSLLKPEESAGLEKELAQYERGTLTLDPSVEAVLGTLEEWMGK